MKRFVELVLMYEKEDVAGYLVEIWYTNDRGCREIHIA